MANLLQKASIVLTPTAYDDGKVLCAKPSEAPYGDFDFSRNSAATRVNAQGLVENVQILSSNLVQNPSFSEEGVQEVSNGSFSQEGAQLITNGDFATDTDWVKGTGWSISGGSANCDGTQASNSLIYQNIGSQANKTVKFSFTVTNYVSGVLETAFFGAAGTIAETISANGDYTFYINVQSGHNGNTGFTAKVGFTGSIDNVSVREVGQDWILGGSGLNTPTIGSNSATITSVDSNSYIQQNSVLTSGKSYKISYEILSSSGSNVLKMVSSLGLATVPTTVGTHTVYGTATTTTFYIERAVIGMNATITNISVKEVGQNWTLGTGWSIGDNVANAVDAAFNSQLVYSDNVVANTKYKVSFNVSNYVKGNVIAKIGNTSSATVSSNGSFTFTLTSANTASFQIATWAGGGTTLSITNISVIEITDDTNLPRINYEGFSYQDALGSEEVVNGDFSSPTTIGWSDNYLCPFSVENNMLKATAQTTGSGMTYQINGLTIGSKYVISWDYINGSGALPKWRVTNSDQSALKTYSDNSNYYYFIPTSTTASFSPLYQCGTAGTFYFDNVSVKEYLGQEVVPNSGCGSWLWEPQSTNLITQSELFSDASWVKINSSVVSGFASPSGNTNAYKLIASASNTDHRTRTAPIATAALGTTVTFSIYIKPQEITKIALVDNWTNLSYGVVNLTTNSVIEEAQGTTSVTEILNGFRRVSFTYQTANINTLPAVYLLDDSYTSGNPTSYTFASNGTSGVYIWGAQLEQQSYATSYIPTSGSTVTRNQDVCSNGGSLATINSPEGTLYAQIAALSNDLTFRAISIYEDSSLDNVITIQYNNISNNIRYLYRQGAVSVSDLNFAVNDIKTTHKVAATWKQNEFKLFIDGIKVREQLSGSVAPADTFVGLDFKRPDGQDFYGKTKALAVWKEALSDQELADLTYPTPTDPTFSLDFDTIAEQFTFARGSEATYVDAQGLIKSTNELGSELITGGDFSNPSDWNLSGANLSIADGKGISTGSNFGAQFTQQILTTNKTYKLVFDIVDYTSGAIGVTANYYGVQQTFNSVGTHTAYFTSLSQTFFRLYSENFIGSIDNVSVKEYTTATNTPRLDYSTGAEAFLLEPQSTNLITQSEDFSQWIDDTDTSITSNAIISPDGTQNADKLIAGNSVARQAIKFNLSASGNIVMSVFAKKGEYSVLQFSDARDPSLYANFDLENGVVGNYNVGTPSIKSMGNEWYRCSINYNAANDIISFRISIAENLTDGRLINFSGNNSDGLYIWGAMLEQQSYATSYIPTSGTTVTRNQETCINATPEINSEEGVLYFEAAAENITTFKNISINDGGTTNRINLYIYSSSIVVNFDVGGVNQASLAYSIPNVTIFNKFAFSYKLNEFKLFVNGVQRAIDTSGAVPAAGTFNQLSFNDGFLSKFFGNTKDVQVYTKALSDAELIKLTT